MAKREFVMLAHKLDLPNPKQHIGGWWWSEKLDGERCFWDGGITRGIAKDQVPWANCAKDARYTEKQIATGLWSRYGNVIHAPNWFLSALPSIPLDGEMWSEDRVFRQKIHSTIKKIVPVDSEWRDIVFMAFDSPPLRTILADGVIDTTNFKRTFYHCWEWEIVQKAGLLWEAKTETRFESTYAMLKDWLNQYDQKVVQLHKQFVLPMPQHLAIRNLEFHLDKIVEAGGEGLMIRDPNKTYECRRSHNLLKMKPFDDMEGVVTGYVTGRETALGSKLLGMMGALVLKLDSGVRLELSGFTDEERRLVNRADPSNNANAESWAITHPETECIDGYEAAAFPKGMRVTFKYRGLSADGVPQEARFFRERSDI